LPPVACGEACGPARPSRNAIAAGSGFLGCCNQAFERPVPGSYPLIAWVNRNLRRAGACTIAEEFGLPPTLSNEQQCHKSV